MPVGGKTKVQRKEKKKPSHPKRHRAKQPKNGPSRFSRGEDQKDIETNRGGWGTTVIGVGTVDDGRKQKIKPGSRDGIPKKEKRLNVKSREKNWKQVKR